MKSAEFHSRYTLLASYPIKHRMESSPINNVVDNGGVAVFSDVIDVRHTDHADVDFRWPQYGTFRYTSLQPSLPSYASLKHQAGETGQEVWTPAECGSVPTLMYPVKEYRVSAWTRPLGDDPVDKPGPEVSMDQWFDDLSASQQGWAGAHWALNFDTNAIDVYKSKA